MGHKSICKGQGCIGFYEFQIYAGNGTIPANSSSLGISGDIVIQLIENLSTKRNFKIVSVFSLHHTNYSLN